MGVSTQSTWEIVPSGVTMDIGQGTPAGGVPVLLRSKVLQARWPKRVSSQQKQKQWQRRSMGRSKRQSRRQPKSRQRCELQRKRRQKEAERLPGRRLLRRKKRDKLG